MTFIRKHVQSVSEVRSGGDSGGEGLREYLFAWLLPRIRHGKVIPFISNNLCYENIFLVDKETEETIENELSQEWARQILYPFPDSRELARVALFNRVHAEDSEQAKTNYLNFLKKKLLALAKNLNRDPALLKELESQVDFGESTFADLVQELGCMKPSPGKTNPLRVLASLSLPVYITTSYHDLLERALIDQGKTPSTKICFWSRETINVNPDHIAGADLSPNTVSPLVYHLLGYERYPKSIAISEDDYLEFLTRVIEDNDTNNPIIPLYLRDAISSSSLLLLGYRLHEWDFRVMFRGVIRPHIGEDRLRSLIIQLDPNEQYHIKRVKKAREYLETYFGNVNFEIEWDQTNNFLKDLSEAWKRSQG